MGGKTGEGTLQIADVQLYLRPQKRHIHAVAISWTWCQSVVPAKYEAPQSLYRFADMIWPRLCVMCVALA